MIATSCDRLEREVAHFGERLPLATPQRKQNSPKEVLGHSAIFVFARKPLMIELYFGYSNEAIVLNESLFRHKDWF